MAMTATSGHFDAQVTRADLKQALENGKTIAFKKQLASKSLTRHLQLLFAGYSKRDIFFAW